MKDVLKRYYGIRRCSVMPGPTTADNSVEVGQESTLVSVLKSVYKIEEQCPNFRIGECDMNCRILELKKQLQAIQ